MQLFCCICSLLSLALGPLGAALPCEDNSSGEDVDGITEVSQEQDAAPLDPTPAGNFDAAFEPVSLTPPPETLVSTATDMASISFAYDVSTEGNWDFLVFCVDTTSCTRTSGYVARWSGLTSGTYTHNVAAGTHDFHWV